jgi:hypothetical protein
MKKASKRQVGFKSDVLAIEQGAFELTDKIFAGVQLTPGLSATDSVTHRVTGKVLLPMGKGTPRIRCQVNGSVTVIGSRSLSDEAKEALLGEVYALTDDGFAGLLSSNPKVRASGAVGFGFYGKAMAGRNRLQVSIHVTAIHSKDWPDNRPTASAPAVETATDAS